MQVIIKHRNSKYKYSLLHLIKYHACLIILRYFFADENLLHEALITVTQKRR